MQEPATETPRERRTAFVQTLIEFNSQRSWYSRRAARLKSRAERTDMFIIVCGALITALPILKPTATHWVDIVIACLGVGVVLAQGAQRTFRHGEVWPGYRKASEQMKRETRLFTNSIGIYDTEESVARNQYAIRLEAIIAAEQKIFFDLQASSKSSAGR
ncbi:hypothetical protein AB833_20950 [Chromatiales bacterium (ex Bugula neritina AB1)]|nr:hypothetical protein AB833_20950 [Chromatiales bacterium (ex Bugula neritina AB1)]